MEKANKPRSGTIAMMAVGALALLLYAWFVAVNLPDAAGGEAKMSQAMESLYALALLWFVLLVLVIMDRVMGGPSWTRRAGYAVLFVAVIANTFATDYPHDLLCQIAVLGLPLLAGAYVALGRLPRQTAARAQMAALLPMAALSAYAFNLFLR